MWLKLAGGDPYPCNVPMPFYISEFGVAGIPPPPPLRGAHCRCVSTDIHGDVLATPHVVSRLEWEVRVGRIAWYS